MGPPGQIVKERVFVHLKSVKIYNRRIELKVAA